MWPTQYLRAGQPAAGPSSGPTPTRGPPPPLKGSPLPGPIRRSVRALQPPQSSQGSAGAAAASQGTSPRGKSLFGSFTCKYLVVLLESRLGLYRFTLRVPMRRAGYNRSYICIV